MDFVIIHIMILSRNDNISWLYLTNKQEFKSQGSVYTNRLFLQLIIPRCLLLCQGFFLHWSFALSWVPFASLCVWLEGKDRVKMAEASVPARGLEQITYDIKHMAAVRKEKRRDKKSVFFFIQKKKKTRKKSRMGSSRNALPFSLFVFSHFSFLLSEFPQKQAWSSPLMSVQLPNTVTEMFAACALSSSQQNLCAFLPEPSERRTMEAEI